MGLPPGLGPRQIRRPHNALWSVLQRPAVGKVAMPPKNFFRRLAPRLYSSMVSASSAPEYAGCKGPSRTMWRGYCRQWPNRSTAPRIHSPHPLGGGKSGRLMAYFAGTYQSRRLTAGRQRGTEMNFAITVREIDPGDKAWLKRQARQVGVSMEEFVRRLIRESASTANVARSPLKPSSSISVPSTASSCHPPSATATDRFRSPTRTTRDRAAGLPPRCQRRLGDDAAEAGTARRRLSRFYCRRECLPRLHTACKILDGIGLRGPGRRRNDLAGRDAIESLSHSGRCRFTPSVSSPATWRG